MTYQASPVAMVSLDAMLFQRTPLPEVVELDPDDGWTQWDLATKLQDAAGG